MEKKNKNKEVDKDQHVNGVMSAEKDIVIYIYIYDEGLIKFYQ